VNFEFCDRALTAAKAAWEMMTPTQRQEFLRWAKPAREYVKATIPSELRWKIWNRDGFKCHYCGSTASLSVDHILAESLGGTLDESNLLTACIRCNSAKGAKDFRAFELERMLQQITEKAFAEIMAMDPTREELLQAAAEFYRFADELEAQAAQMKDDQ